MGDSCDEGDVGAVVIDFVAFPLMRMANDYE